VRLPTANGRRRRHALAPTILPENFSVPSLTRARFVIPTAFVTAFHGHFTRDPNRALALGVESRSDVLPDPSREQIRLRLDEARALLASLDGLHVGTLGFDDGLDLELARLMLDAEVHRDSYQFNGKTRLEQLPTAGDDIGDGLFQLFVNDPRPAAERLANILSRLEQVPDYVASLLERLDTPLARWVQIDLAKVDGLPQLFDGISEWAAATDFADCMRLARARTRAEAALTRYAGRLSALPTTTDLHVGDGVARRIVRLRGIELELEQLARIARDFLARIGEQVEELRSRLVLKYDLPKTTSAAELERLLKSRYLVALPGGDLEQILRRYERERERILEFVTSRRLFPIPADQNMKILRTPRFMQPSIPAGAMMSPPPFRAGTKTSLIYLTLSDELRAEHTELSIPAMMIHEGIPGHHLQLASAALHPSVIRRHVEAMDQAEGWTTMLEDYMLDLGYMGELADEARLIGRRDLSRLGARVAIDLFFMTGDRGYLDVGVGQPSAASDPFEAAAELLSNVTGFVPGRVQAELNWYSQERGYPLSYLTGNHLVWQLKKDVVAEQPAPTLDVDREFHRVFLEAGNMPLGYLRRVYEQKGLLRPSAPASNLSDETAR
jgi:uncharacterized protein (DUF885 family)